MYAWGTEGDVEKADVPLDFILLEHSSLGVIADNPWVNKSGKIEPL